ncbi:MAG: NAD(P)H-hydrate epimerase [Candidatus Dormibacteria bacterium]
MGKATALRQEYGDLTATDVAALDGATIELGVGVGLLMEVAGLQVARLAWRLLGERPGSVRVLAGHGHNGGDGLVAARHLCAWDCAVDVEVLAARHRLDELTLGNCRAAAGAGARIAFASAGGESHIDADLTIDAVLGTGVRGAIREDTCARLGTMRPPILSIDVPSGMDASTGIAAQGTVRADATLTLGGCKRGFWTAMSRTWTGDLYAVSIGIPPAAWRRCGLTAPSRLRGGDLVGVPPDVL